MMEPGKFPSALWGHLFAVTPGATFEAYFRALNDPKFHSQNLGHILERNPALIHLLHGLDLLQARQKKWQEDAPERKKGEPPPRVRPLPSEQLLAAIGKFQIRDALVSLRMQRTGSVDTLPRKAKDKFSLATKTPLKFALQTEAFCEDRRMANPEKAFAAGLHYDWLLLRLAQEKGSPREVRTYAEKLWKEGMKIGRIAYALSGHLKNLKLSPFAFSAGLLLPHGKAWMAWLFDQAGEGSPSWKEFQAECLKHGDFQVRAEQHLEPRRFPVTSLELSSLFVSSLGLLKEAEKAIRFSGEPELLKKVDPESHLLARILGASKLLADGGELSKLSPIGRRFVLSFGIPESELKDLMTRIQGDAA